MLRNDLADIVFVVGYAHSATPFDPGLDSGALGAVAIHEEPDRSTRNDEALDTSGVNLRNHAARDPMTGSVQPVGERPGGEVKPERTSTVPHAATRGCRRS